MVSIVHSLEVIGALPFGTMTFEIGCLERSNLGGGMYNGFFSETGHLLLNT